MVTSNTTDIINLYPIGWMKKGLKTPLFALIMRFVRLDLHFSKKYFKIFLIKFFETLKKCYVCIKYY